MYRIYDQKKSKWCDIDRFYMSCFEDLYEYAKKGLGSKLSRVRDENRYVMHKSLGLYDENDVEVYEGDIVEGTRGDGKICRMVVAYVPAHAQYVLLDENDKSNGLDGTYYMIEEEFLKELEVIGNVFDSVEDGHDLIVEETEEVVDDVSDEVESVEAEVIEESGMREE